MHHHLIALDQIFVCVCVFLCACILSSRHEYVVKSDTVPVSIYFNTFKLSFPVLVYWLMLIDNVTSRL